MSENKYDLSQVEEQVVNENTPLFMIIYGKAGVAKSTVASMMGENVFFEDVEGTADKIQGIKRVSVDSFKDVAGWKNSIMKNDEYDTLVIDGFKKLEMMLEDEVATVLGRKEFSDHKYGDTYLKKRYIAHKFLQSILGRGKNLIIICHESEVEMIDESTDESYISIAPNIKDKELKVEIAGLADIVAHMEVHREEGKKIWKMDLTPYKGKVCKNRFDIEDPIKAESTKELVTELKTKIKDFYKKQGGVK